MKRAACISAFVAQVMAGVSGLVLGALCLMLLGDVLGRALGHPLFGAQDLAEMVMVIATFAALPLLEAKGQQIRVDLLARPMTGWPNRLSFIAAKLLGVAIWGGLAVAVFQAAQLSALLGLSSNILALPKAPFQYALSGLAALAALDGLLRLMTFKAVSHG